MRATAVGTAVVAALSVGCATLPNKATGNVAAMRGIRDGLCARGEVSGSGGLLNPSTVIHTCIQVGAPGTLADDGRTPTIMTKLMGWDFPTATPGSYQLEVWRNGKLVMKQMLPTGPSNVPGVGPCVGGDCMKIGVSVVAFPSGWEPGEYVFKYTCSFNTSYVAQMSATVTP